jgi:hypothetical protein
MPVWSQRWWPDNNKKNQKKLHQSGDLRSPYRSRPQTTIRMLRPTARQEPPQW